MLRVAFAGVVLATASVGMSGVALAQWGWAPAPWDDGRELRRYPYPYQYPSPYYRQPPGDYWGGQSTRRRPGPASRSGGPRPAIASMEPSRIAFPSAYPVGSIVIDHKGRQLLFIQSATMALRYPISVGREGFTWTGEERISKTVDWPDWYPPDEMRARDPSLPEHMSGGLKNPLGAKALYLGKTLYRIHGTNDPTSIGKAASSGCFRMLNGHVVDLAARIEIGTPVTVVGRLSPELERTVAEQVRGHAALAPDAPPRVKALAPPPAVKAAPPAVKAAPPPPVVKAPAPPPAVKAPAAPAKKAPAGDEGPAGEGLGGRDGQPS